MTTASEYINKLIALIAEHGDLEVVDSENGEMPEPTEEEGVFVLADPSQD